MINKNDIAESLKAVMAIADCIKEAKRIPSGHLYAQVMAFGCTLETYESIIGLLTSGDKPLVKKENNELIWMA